MNREQHLQWCKDRALEYVATGDMLNAFSSFLSDMSKHKETANHLALEMGTMLMLGGHLRDKQSMTNWINGFN